MKIARIITVICILSTSFYTSAQSVTNKNISPVVSGQTPNTTLNTNTKDPDSNGVAITEIQAVYCSLNCFPNPAQENIRLNISTNKDGMYRLELVNIAGQRVYISSIKLNEGQNTTSIDIAELPKGIYLLGLNNASGTVQSFRIYKY